MKSVSSSLPILYKSRGFKCTVDYMSTVERSKTRSSRKQFSISGVAPPLRHIASKSPPPKLPWSRVVGGESEFVDMASPPPLSPLHSVDTPSPAYALVDDVSSALGSSGQVWDGLVRVKDEEAPRRPWRSRGRRALV
ncbi:hypothetical protein VNO77_23060 [Canavalia gladiata]|uniref:Uncharacterized protein n=1 Tax=Canavalia gladiata TaxID=3824 RepID=A0AAN9QF24_CANGL